LGQGDPCFADQPGTEALGINGHLVLSISRVTYTNGDKPIEFVASLYLGDRYQLRVILR
jgi:DNA-binding GntR family transcriptional regulator